MNAQDQIKERARLASKAIEGLCYPYKLGDVQDIIEAELTAQQTADAAAHRELKREHNETLDVLLSLRNSCDDALYQRDTARAESAKLRVVLGKVTAALLRVQNWYACDGSISTCHSAFDGTNEALALAATVLKEGE